MKWGLQINFNKTESMVVGGTGKDLMMEEGNVVKCCAEKFKHGIAKGRVIIRQLHSIIWNKNIKIHLEKNL